MTKHTTRLFLLIFILLALIGGTLFKAYDFGRNAFLAKDFATARKWYWIAANIGNEKAQSNLGSLYADGFGGRAKQRAGGKMDAEGSRQWRGRGKI